MTQITTKDTPPKGIGPGEDLPRGNILDHLDKLTQSKGGKYFCPVCEGNDLSINPKTGALTCYTNECSWKSIMDIIAPLEKRGGKKPINGASTKRGQPRKFSSPSDKDKAAAWAEIGIEARVTEIFYEIECGSSSPAEANIALSAWCKEHGHNAYAAGQLLKEKLKKLKDTSGWDEDELTPVLLKDYQKIREKFGDRLRYNTLFNQVELDGERFDPAAAKIELIVEQRMKLKSGRDDIGDCVMKIAKDNQYNPVEEYLLDCHRTHGQCGDFLQGFADRTLGAVEPIHNILVVKFLVSAVARIFEPGCKVDSALILQGAQGWGKSSFFQILASSDWFDDSFGNASDKDERLKLHSAWLLEWAELETVFRRKDVSAVKAFITTKIDRIRPPYGRSIEFLSRRSVFCGTTNEAEFLSDPTGNRRFWIVPMGRRLDFQALERDRDQIWAAAVALYKSGYRWDLSHEEEQASKELARQYESNDVWFDEVADWVEGREKISIQEILTSCLRIELHSQSKKEELRIRSILTRLNWQQVRNPVLHSGKRVRIWTPPEGFQSESTVPLCQDPANADF